MSKQRYLVACAFSVLACGIAAPAAAQVGGNTTPAQAQLPADQGDVVTAPAGPDIIVTGSLIRGSREDGAAPVDVISGEELAKQGAPSVVDLLKNLPTSNGVIGDANQFDSRSQGNEGVASVNLRGLGPQRTLVLLNGRRIVPIGGGIPIVDVNLIPTGAIGRVEVLKDGAAATYGSDAIAGVVNFITRTDQEGFIASGDYRYIRGSRGDYGGAVSYGHVGNGFRMLASFGYQHRSELRTTDRNFVVQPYPNNPQGGYTGGGNPGNFDFNGPLAGGNVFTTDLGCTGVGGFRSAAGSTTDRCFDNYGQFGNLVEPEDRYQAFVDFSADLTDRLKFNVTALYGHSSTRITTSPTYLPTLSPSGYAANGLSNLIAANGSPVSAFTGGANAGGLGLFVIPTYSPALRDYCALYGAASGCVTAGGVPTQPASAFPVLFRPALLGGNPVFAQVPGNDRGSAFSKRESDSIRFTGELRYAVNSDIDLTASGTYSQYYRDGEGTDTFGDLFQNALAGFGGPNCAYASAASRAGLSSAQLAAVAGTNGCTFFNPFSTAVSANAATNVANPNYAGTRSPTGFSLTPGAGLINDLATFDNFFQTTRTTYDTKLYVADLVLSGKSGLHLPGGDLAFALGAQYRRNTYTVMYNAVSNLAQNPCPGTPLAPTATCIQQTGALGFLGTNRNNSVSGDVRALFAELQVPIIQQLNLQLSARYEDYGGSVGSTFNPQARAKFQLTPWLSLRGGAGTTFRGPPAQQLSGNLTALQIIGSSFRAVDINGNPKLNPEKATTYSGGVIVQTGGFFASLDYFKYKLKGPIEGEPIQGIVSTLFGASGAANCNVPAYAALQARFTFSGGVCNIGNVQRLRTVVFNSADVSTSGLDLQVSLKERVGPGAITVGVNGTYVIDYKTRDITVEGIIVQPAFDGVGLLNYQTTAYPLPRIKGNVYAQADMGSASLRLQLNHINGYTDQRGAAIFGPNTGALAGASVTAGKNISAFDTVDATFRVSVRTGTTLAISAQNIFDRDPPFARLDQNYDPFTGSPLGFTVKGAITQKF